MAPIKGLQWNSWDLAKHVFCQFSFFGQMQGRTLSPKETEKA